MWIDRDDIEGELLDPSKRVPRPLVSWEHFEWFVQYQVREELYSRIAKRVGRDVRAVMFGCKEVARRVDLPLRPTRRGRPRSSEPAVSHFS